MARPCSENLFYYGIIHVDIIVLPNIISKKGIFMQLDRIDFVLLQQLRTNARLPNKTLAERAGIAPSTTLERVRRLHEAGVIKGYHAEVAPGAVGIGLQAMISVRQIGRASCRARGAI